MTAQLPAGAAVVAGGTLLVIGGAEDRGEKPEILRRFVEIVHGGRVVVASVASRDASRELWDQYRRVFRSLGVRDVVHLDVATRDDAFDAGRVAAMRGARGVFFTGGSQLRITSLLGDSPVYRELRELYRRGGVIGGTSAGASAMSATMMVAGQGSRSHRLGDNLRQASGLALIGGVLIDQHFAERGRLGRLVAAVAQNPASLGVGIDENTAIEVVDASRFTVLGDGAVYVVDGRHVRFSNIAEGHDDDTLRVHGLALHVLAAGDCFDLVKREPTPP